MPPNEALPIARPRTCVTSEEVVVAPPGRTLTVLAASPKLVAIAEPPGPLAVIADVEELALLFALEVECPAIAGAAPRAIARAVMTSVRM